MTYLLKPEVVHDPPMRVVRSEENTLAHEETFRNVEHDPKGRKTRKYSAKIRIGVRTRYSPAMEKDALNLGKQSVLRQNSRKLQIDGKILSYTPRMAWVQTWVKQTRLLRNRGFAFVSNAKINIWMAK